MPSNTYGRQVLHALTNKSGGAVAKGDVVVVDTGNDEAFTTSTAGAVTGGVGVVEDAAIANNAVGRVVVEGYASLVNVSASVTRGHFGKTHTVVKQAVSAGASRGVGTFCQFLTGGTTPTARVYPPDLNASSGNVATDAIWDAAGDLAVGSGADTAAKLAKGAAGGALSVINGVVAWNSGTSFPGSKATGDRFWRTDLGMECYWDGAQWLTAQRFQQTLAGQDQLIPFSVTSTFFTPLWNGDYSLYIEKIYAVTAVITTNNGTNYWTVALSRGPSNTSLGSFTTAADTAGVNTAHTITVNAATGTTDLYAVAGYTKTLSPGVMYAHIGMVYRLIVT